MDAHNDLQPELRHIVSIKNLCFSYSDGSNVFENLNLLLGDVPHTCIVGPDGAGKTTLAKLIKGLLIPQSGQLLYDGNIHRQIGCIGYVASDPDDNLVGITVEDDIVFGLENLGLSEREIRQRLDLAIQWTGLTGMEKRIVHSLSGGERQKLAVASVMAMGAKLVICDEATTMLDPEARIMVKNCLRSLHQQLGTIIIETTSILADSLDADMIVFLECGKVIFQGSPLEFITNPGGQRWFAPSTGLLGLMRELYDLGIHEVLNNQPLLNCRSLIFKLLQC